MKFTIKKTTLINFLKTPIGILDAAHLNPSYLGVLLKTENNKLSVICLNNSLSFFSSIELATIDTNGEVLVSGKFLYDIVSKIKEEDITIQLVDNSVLRISTTINKYSADINLLDTNTFPTIDFSFNSFKEHKINTDFFKSVIEKSSNIIVENVNSSSVLNGVLFDAEREENKIECVATDGKHLSYLTQPYNGDKFKIVINIKSLQTINQSIQNEKEILFYLNNRQLFVVLSNKVFKCKLLDGEYVATAKTLQTPQPYGFLINKQDLFSSIEKGSVLAVGQKAPHLLFKIKENNLEVKCRNIDSGNSQEDLSISGYKGEEMEFSFAVKLILDLIKNIEGEQILFEFSSSIRPFFLKDPNNCNYISLIAPTKI